VGEHSSTALRAALSALGVWLALYGANLVVQAAPRTGLLFGKSSHLVVDFGGGLLCALGALRRRGADRAAWLLIATGIVAWAAGDVYWTVMLADKDSIPVPSPADVGYLLFPVLTFLGMAGVLRSRVRAAPRHLWVDGLAASLAVAAVAAAIVVPAVTANVGGDWKSVATNVAYPLSDLILLGLVVGAIALGGWRLDRMWTFAGAGVTAFWMADTHYLFAVAAGGGGFPDPWDVGWDGAFLALAGASVLAVRASRAVPGRSRRTTLLPLAFGAAGLGVLVYAGLHGVTPVAVVLAGLSLLAVGARLWMAFAENRVMLEATRRESVTDALTGLGNRRALARDLEELLDGASVEDPLLLVLFDLDGFKSYNDSYGHPAGDDLLVRLGVKLGRRVAPAGRAYRMGGDEFCALLRPGKVMPAVAAAEAALALNDSGEGFDVGSSHGEVLLPAETEDPAEALRLADRRMYQQKHGGRASAGSQSRDVLLRALAERSPDLGDHLSTVAELAVAVARRLGLPAAAIEEVRHAADLHDVGKVAIPDAILNKPGPLDDEEWAFMRRHTIIGERIVAAAPALREVAALVRASHERHDGQGYPDGLAGRDIPLGARIVAVCDSFDAMVADRPYRPALPADVALAELARCAGSQFDPAVVTAFLEAYDDLADHQRLPRAA
jgi:diguanylate cyclase (GGDEF)-like protein